MADLPALHGIVPILVTPFDDADRVDTESLRREVEFNIEAGVHGLGIALGSEVYKLTDDERDQVVASVIAQARGRVPVIVNTGAPATRLAVRYSQQAEAAGAAAVMCTAPGPGLPVEEVRHYYQSISSAISVPVMVQDTAANHIPAGLLRSIAESAERVRYAKVESSPPARRVYDAVQACGALVAIFGGAGGGALLQELRRGSIGTMPWPSTPAAFVAVWNHWQKGDRAAALAVFEQQLAPVQQLSVQGIGGGHLLHKELLRRQGVIATAHVRRPSDDVEPLFWDELDEVCDRLGIGGALK